MFPNLNHFGDDRSSKVMIDIYRHRYRHPSKPFGGNALRRKVTIGDDRFYLRGRQGQKRYLTAVYRAVWRGDCRLSSPIVTNGIQTQWWQRVRAVTIAVTMRKTSFYRHPHRHRHDVCEATAAGVPCRLGRVVVDLADLELVAAGEVVP